MAETGEGFVRELLAGVDHTPYDIVWAGDATAARQAVNGRSFDICLIDLAPAEVAVSLVAALARGDGPPCVVLAETDNRALDLAAMAAGASGFIVKGEASPAVLEKAIRYAMDRYAHEQELTRLAEFDPLTGLLNRDAFGRRLEEAMASAERNGKHLAVLSVDLDDFKDVNDTLGHGVGDTLIGMVADRLKSVKRKTDVVGRMGGDEFAVLAVNLDREAGATQPARRILDALSAPYDIDGKTVHAGASIGVTTYPTDARNARALLVNADRALHRAKGSGRRGVFFFDAKMQRNVQRRTRLESDLRKAVENGDLVAHFQPQIDLRGRAVSGAEALVRWPHPELGMVPPGSFVPIAEATGLIAPLGEQVLQQACAACVGWSAALGRPLRVSVNLSPHQFHLEDLATRVLDIVSASGLAPAQLEVEITEATVMRNIKQAVDDLQTLREAGIRIAIDDFGTGYSSLAYLKRFPVDHLKIDRSFIEGVDSGAEDRAIVGSVVGLAHALGMAVIAEGVERESQLAFLQGQSCDEVQGFLFSPALASDAFESWVETFHAGAATSDAVLTPARQEGSARP